MKMWASCSYSQLKHRYSKTRNNVSHFVHTFVKILGYNKNIRYELTDNEVNNRCKIRRCCYVQAYAKQQRQRFGQEE